MKVLINQRVNGRFVGMGCMECGHTCRVMIAFGQGVYCKGCLFKAAAAVDEAWLDARTDGRAREAKPLTVNLPSVGNRKSVEEALVDILADIYRRVNKD